MLGRVVTKQRYVSWWRKGDIATSGVPVQFLIDDKNRKLKVFSDELPKTNLIPAVRVY